MKRRLKTEDQPEDKRNDAPSKWKAVRKECELASELEERREPRKKRARITEVEKLQIAAGNQKNLPRGRAAIIEQRRPRTKAMVHKVPKGNGARWENTEASGGRQRQECGHTKAINILITE